MPFTRNCDNFNGLVIRLSMVSVRERTSSEQTPTGIVIPGFMVFVVAWIKVTGPVESQLQKKTGWSVVFARHYWTDTCGITGL